MSTEVNKWEVTTTQAAKVALDQLDKQIRDTRDELDRMVANALTMRANIVAHCQHSFPAPLKGHEHEGSNCIHCDVNNIYLSSLERTRKMGLEQQEQKNQQ